MSTYWLARGGKQLGPYSIGDLRRMVTDGSAAIEDAVWAEGMTNWVPLSQVVPRGRPTPPPPPPTTTAGRDYAVRAGDRQLRFPLVLYPKRSKSLFVLLASAIFVAIGVWMIQSGGADAPIWAGYASVVFFGLGIVVGIIQLFPGSAFLRLDDAGFTFCSLFRQTSLRWTDIDQFFVVDIRAGFRTNEMVAWNFAPPFQGNKRSSAFSQALADCDAGLPDTYGKRAEELAGFMNECLAQAVARM